MDLDGASAISLDNEIRAAKVLNYTYSTPNSTLV
jgi:hypothetical protein